MSSDVVPYQLPVHHVFQFAMLASALIWAKENWVSQQVISVQPIQAIHPQHTVSVLNLLLDPFQQDLQQIGTDVCGMSREMVSAEALTAHAGNGSHCAAAP
uniref:Uncharacterized protein n=1 Tax=Oryza rufipogon TaxID=4529 RepID=A0A0E0QIK5_ORYRU